jgi:RNA polymerase sigma-70 factor (ECF subfamily)
MLNDCSNLTDNELVDKVLEDQDYFRCIVNRYEDKLTRYILRITSVNKEDAEDILQDVFINVYKNLNGFDGNLKFSSWIYRITHNQVISRWRKEKNTPTVFKNDDNLELFNKIMAEDDLFLELTKKDLEKEVGDILGKLKKEYAEVLVLKFLEEKSYREISDILKKPMGTVATLINRAKKDFKQIMNRQSNNK